MSWLDRCWTSATGVVCAIGLFEVLHSLGLLATIGIFVSAAVLGLMTVLPWMTTVTWRSTPLVIGGPVLGTLTVVFVGLMQLAALPALLVTVVLVTLSPPVRGWVTGLVARHRTPAPTAEGVALTPHDGPPSDGQQQSVAVLPEADLVVPDLMDASDLCQAWRSSFVALERAKTVASRLRVVEMRALYLDELERRAGPALQAWFSSGPRAAGDPSRYVCRAEHQSPPSRE